MIKKKDDVFQTLNCIVPYLRVNQKKRRATWILEHYEEVTPRNGKYNQHLLKEKLAFEDLFFKI